MSFDINRLIDMIEKQLGNLVTNIFIAFILFGITAWLGAHIINDAFLPLLSGLEKMNLKETGFWKTVHALTILFLFSCGVALLYFLSRNRSLAGQKLSKIREMKTTFESSLKDIHSIYRCFFIKRT